MQPEEADLPQDCPDKPLMDSATVERSKAQSTLDVAEQPAWLVSVNAKRPVAVPVATVRQSHAPGEWQPPHQRQTFEMLLLLYATWEVSAADHALLLSDSVFCTGINGSDNNTASAQASCSSVHCNPQVVDKRQQHRLHVYSDLHSKG